MDAGRVPRVLTILALAACGASCNRPVELENPVFEAGQLTSAQVCGECHADIHAFWLNSRHAAAAAGDAFLAALENAGDETMRMCLGCHAPASRVTGSLDPSHPLNREGVSCDICHSLVDTRLDRPDDPLVLEVGPVKLGPIRDASSSGHEVAYSALHAEARHCAGCHEYPGPEGVGVLATYSEWLEYQAGGGTQICQDCHMPRMAANLVDPKLQRSAVALVNVHQMPGGSSPEQLAQAARLEIEDPAVQGSAIEAKVRVTNLGAGHRFPTGLANRQIVLRLELRFSDGRSWSDERVFERVLTDAAGNPIREDARLFLAARQVSVDTRLAPGESRVEAFSIPWTGAEDFTMTASLEYRRAEQVRTGDGQPPFQSVTRAFGNATP